MSHKSCWIFMIRSWVSPQSTKLLYVVYVLFVVFEMYELKQTNKV